MKNSIQWRYESTSTSALYLYGTPNKAIPTGVLIIHCRQFGMSRRHNLLYLQW